MPLDEWAEGKGAKGRVTVAHDGMIDRLDVGLGYGEHGLSRHSFFFYLLILTMSSLVQLLHFWRAWGYLTAKQSTARRVVLRLHQLGVFCLWWRYGRFVLNMYL